MIMCLNGKNAYKSCPIMDRSVGVRKGKDNRIMSSYVLISSDYMKLLCDFKSILKYDCNSEKKWR